MHLPYGNCGESNNSSLQYGAPAIDFQRNPRGIQTGRILFRFNQLYSCLCESCRAIPSYNEPKVDRPLQVLRRPSAPVKIRGVLYRELLLRTILVIGEGFSL